MKRLLLTPLLCLVLAAPSRAEEPLEKFLRASLQAQPEPEGDGRSPLPAGIVRGVAASQPHSGDFLLALASDNSSPLQRRATNALMACWDSLSAAQVSAYLRQSIALSVDLRPAYPEGFDAPARFSYGVRYGWGGFPAQAAGFKLKTRTTHFVDGKLWGDPFEYEGPQATTGWLKTGGLSFGKHVASMKLAFEFEHNGQHGAGEVESRPFPFRIADAALPDDLEGVQGTQDEGLVRAFLRVSDIPQAPRPQNASDWNPQMGRQNGMTMPTWQLLNPLPFALCFEVELHEPDGRVTKGSSIFIEPGQTRYNNFDPYSPRPFMEGRKGLIPVRVVLQPSYSLALSDPAVRRFYAGKLEFDLHFNIADQNIGIAPLG